MPHKGRGWCNLFFALLPHTHALLPPFASTTHFMEEADLLGDRIAIMAAGTLRCLGSSRFLKEQYGVGYHLTMVKQDGCSASALKNLVRDHVPEAKVLSDVGAEFSMQLPFTASAAFPDLFDKLDHDKCVLRGGASKTGSAICW